MKRIIVLAGGILMLSTTFTSYAGASYKFAVSCTNQRLVAEWNTGDIDPGKEYLRTATAGQYGPDCQIGDFNPTIDGGLPVDTYSHEGGVVSGAVGVVCGLLHFGC